MQVLSIVSSLVSTLMAVVAAAAAVIALFYARQAVQQGRDGQREAHMWRREDVAERQAAQLLEAQARADALAGLRKLHDHLAASHQQQMAEQASAREAELAIQRLTALGRLAETLVNLAGVAWEESKNPPKPAPYRLPPTQLHVMNSQLRTSLALYTALGGQPVDGIDPLLADLDMYLGGEPTEKFVGMAKSALEGVARAANRDKH